MEKESTPTYGGLQISSGPVIFTDNKFKIGGDWKLNSYVKAYGKTEGSTYFNWEECHDIKFKLPTGETWRVPTNEDIRKILRNKRNGTIYNGFLHARFALISINKPFAKKYLKNENNGLIIFPDNKIIKGVKIKYINKDEIGLQDLHNKNKEISEEELNELIKQGCAYLPAIGEYCSYDDFWDREMWSLGGKSARYWINDEDYRNKASALDTRFYHPMSGNKTKDYFPVRLVRE